MKFNNKTLKKGVQDWLINKNFALKEYGHISNWDTSKVTDMSELFYRARFFNEDLSSWDVGKHSSMQ